MAEIKSPLPGIFYRKPNPDQPPFKNEGDTVKIGDVIGLVEVMKSYFEVKADSDGKVKKFLINDQDSVSAGEIIVELE